MQKDGRFLPAGTALYQATADSDPTERKVFSFPLPCRLLILRPSGSYLPSGLIGRLEYGPALAPELRTAARECRRLQSEVKRLQAEARLLQTELARPQPPLEKLLAALTSRLSAVAPYRPLAILRLTELARLLPRPAGSSRRGAILPPALQQDRDREAIIRWCEAKAASADANRRGLPPVIATHESVLWETITSAFCARMASRSRSAEK